MEQLILTTGKKRVIIDIQKLIGLLMPLFQAAITKRPDEEVAKEKLDGASKTMHLFFQAQHYITANNQKREREGFEVNHQIHALDDALQAHQLEDPARFRENIGVDPLELRTTAQHLNERELRTVLELAAVSLIHILEKTMESSTGPSDNLTLDAYTPIERYPNLGGIVQTAKNAPIDGIILLFLRGVDLNESYSITLSDALYSNHPLRLNRSSEYRDALINLLVANGVVQNDKEALRLIFLAKGEPIPESIEKLRFANKQDWFKMAAIFDHYHFYGKTTSGVLSSAINHKTTRIKWIRENVLLEEKPLLGENQFEKRMFAHEQKACMETSSFLEFLSSFNSLELRFKE
jgi:hypothetical protein